MLDAAAGQLSPRPSFDAAATPRPGGSAVLGIGVAVPEMRVTNKPIAAHLGVSEEWIRSRTGIGERRIAAAGETVVGLGATAAGRALDDAAVTPADVDLVLVATVSHERLLPGAAPELAARTGAERAGAFDLGAACAGFVYGLSLAASQVESGRAEHVLVVGADVLSRMTDQDDKRTAALFGDAAGAAVVGAAAEGRIGPAVLGSDGFETELITAEHDERLIRMNGHDTFREAVNRLSEATSAAVARSGRTTDDIDVFAFHQANARILTAVGERLGLDPDRVINCIDRFGNTSAASIPLALADAEERGVLVDRAAVLVAGFGAGLTWGAIVIEWGSGDA